MLVTENIFINGKEFRHNYSDAGFYIIRNDGVKYSDAIDILEAEYTYTEDNELIEGYSDIDDVEEEAEPIEEEDENSTDIE